MRRQKDREGYISIDHRFSPGVPAEVAIATGFDPSQMRAGAQMEGAVLCCKHCQTPQIKNPLRTRERGFCRKCNHYICDICAFRASQPDYVHAPFDKVIDDALREAALVIT